MNGHCCKNLNVATCAGFIGFGECMRLALLAVCSGDPAGRIDSDFEFLSAPVGLNIQDRVNEVARCGGFVRSGAEPCGLCQACCDLSRGYLSFPLRFVDCRKTLPHALSISVIGDEESRQASVATAVNRHRDGS